MYFCMISHNRFKQRSPYNFEQIAIWYVCRDRTVMAPSQGHTYHLVKIVLSNSMLWVYSGNIQSGNKTSIMRKRSSFFQWQVLLTLLLLLNNYSKMQGLLKLDKTN